MEKFSDCFNLGNITKLHGLKGDVQIFMDVDNPFFYENLPMVMVEINGSLIPYMIDSIKIKNHNTAIVHFQDINTTEIASGLIGNALYLPLEYLPKLTGNSFYYWEVEGFSIKDVQSGEIGIIKDVLDNTVQPIFQILNGDKEILIPVADEFIVEVNRKEKYIVLNCPEGLIDLYLNG